jgi:hypothetical protein
MPGRKAVGDLNSSDIRHVSALLKITLIVEGHTT